MLRTAVLPTVAVIVLALGSPGSSSAITTDVECGTRITPNYVQSYCQDTSTGHECSTTYYNNGNVVFRCYYVFDV